MVRMPLSRREQEILLQLALDSIREGLEHNRPLDIDVTDFEPTLRQKCACFVTLNRLGNLRGCIGHLEAVQALMTDVAENAFAAAFRDPRFPPLKAEELAQLDLHISILTPAEPLTFDSEQDLLRQLQPGVDGLILQDGLHRGTFLPSVWEQLPEPEQFLSHLKRKAGLPVDYWSASLKVFSYTSETIGAKVSELA
jgi:hypothetical protein